MGYREGDGILGIFEKMGGKVFLAINLREISWISESSLGSNNRIFDRIQRECHNNSRLTFEDNGGIN